MSKINLLPWREEVKKILNYRFYALAGLAILMGITCVFLAHTYIVYRIAVEQNNINFLQKEEKGISTKVAEIKGLQQDKLELLSRMAIIATLQNDRILVVKLIDMLPRVVPEGVFLKSITRVEDKVTIVGNARTNSGASLLLRNLEDPKWSRLVWNPRITELQANKQDDSLDFNLSFTLGTG